MPITPSSSSGTPLLKVDDVKLPSPSEYEVSVQEITKSSRNARGTLFKYHLSWKRTIHAVWYAVPQSMLKTIAEATDSNDSMTVRYFDPESKTVKTGKFYRGNDYKVTGVGVFKWTGTDATRSPQGHSHYRIEMSLVEY